MIKRSDVQRYQKQAAHILEQTGIVLTDAEKANLEIATFGLDDFVKEGLAIVVYENNERYCAKELVLFPSQTCPEHKHPPVGDEPGKMETFRCRAGKVWLYVEGDGSAESIQATIPQGSEKHYHVFHEIELHPGDQYTIPPNVLHWFQAGEEGSVVSEFSSRSRDEQDIFSDTRVKRIPEIEEDA